MDWFNATDYEIARQVLQRGIAAVFVIAFLSTAAQFPALLGERGLLPATELVASQRGIRGPTLFRHRYSDRMLRAVAFAGAVVGLALVLGIPQAGPPLLPMLAFLLMFALYLSIINIGQVFYGFGWEMLLVEAGFHAAFLGSDAVPPPLTMMVLTTWLVFRLEFGAGMIKLRGDKAWRDLTAMYFHHETQPMPNPMSRIAHLLPKPIHRLEVLGNHIVQLVVPFLLFIPGTVGSIAGLLVILTQGWLVVTGNFAWLNVLTMILAFAPITDTFLHSLIPAIPLDLGSGSTAPDWFVGVVMAVTALMVALSFWPIRNLLSKRQAMNRSFNRWNLQNAYGAFGSMTRERYEIVVEGTAAEHPTDDDWLEYGFKGKPGDVRRMPRQFAPYHLRLDWLMWFLALGSPGESWFIPFLIKLLEADRATLKLLRVDPFHGERPRSVRARVFLYRFASHAEKRATGDRWVRTELGVFARPIALREH